MSRPVGIPFDTPPSAPLHTWWAWVRMVRAGERPATREDFNAYLAMTGGKMKGNTGVCDKPSLRYYKSANLMGRKAFREMCARIKAGKCDPRFVVGLDAIMWDGSRGVAA